MKNLGVQLYCLKNELDHDLWGTMKELKKIGYHSVELLVAFDEEYAAISQNINGCIWSEKQAVDNILKLKKIGLEVVFCHLMFDPTKSICEYEDKVITFSKISGIKHFVTSYTFSTKEECEFYATGFNQVIKNFTKEGITLSYHNNSSEFTVINVDGKKIYAMDYFLDLCKPEITLQVDTGWVVFGKADVVSFMKKAGKRIVSIHLKDLKEGFSNETIDQSFVAIGDGVAKTKEILENIDEYNIYENAIIVDQDKSNISMLEDLKKGFQNIQNMM